MKKKVIIWISVAVILFIVSIIFSLINMGNNKIFARTYIDNVLVSNLTQDEAIELLTEKYNAKKDKGITLKYKDFEKTIYYNELGIDVDIEDAVKEAYMIGRNGNIIINNYEIIYSYLVDKEVNLLFTKDREKMDVIIAGIEQKLPDTKKDYSYEIVETNLVINPGTAGIVIEGDRLKDRIMGYVEDLNDLNNVIEIPVKDATPSKIVVSKLKEEVEQEVQDAYVDKLTGIHKEKDGIEFAISDEEIENMLKEEKEEYTIPLKITKPSKTVETLGEDMFVNLLATFTTNFDSSNVNRNNNLVLAAEKLNGTIVNPGEEFSYNDTLGQRTVEAGFKEAGVYSGDGVEIGLGGGICQMSSTLYNAVLLSDLEVTERSNHMYLTHYIDAGKDATVSWGTLDFKFKNNRTYPVKIVAQAGDGVCRVDIRGIKEDTDKTVIVESKVLEYLPYETKYKYNGSLEYGQEVVVQDGEDGCVSETYVTKISSTQGVEKTLISKDTYQPLNKIVERSSY